MGGGAMTLLSASGVGVRFGDRVLFESVTFLVRGGERWGIVGRNGSGKTTLFNILLGAEPSEGRVARAGGLRVSLMDQHRDFGAAASVWEAASGPFAELLALERSLEQQAHDIAAAGEALTQARLDRYDRDLERFQREDGYAIAARVDAVLAGLGFDPERSRSQEIATLSGGERGRLALVRQLVAPADLLLLDEPTNHLDLDTTRWLEEYLGGVAAAVILVSHDRVLLDNLVDHVLHIEARTATVYEGNYSSFVEQRAARRLAMERAHARQAAIIARQEDYIARNLAGQNSRQAIGRRKRLERLPRLSPPPGEAGTMSVRFEPGERGGDQVLVAEGLRIGFGERVLLADFTATVRRGEVIGLVGPNGAGKSTLLGALTGVRPGEGGSVRIPESITIAHYRQDLGEVPRDDSLYDVIAGLRTRWTRGQVQGHLGRYGFTGDAVLRRAGTLSGGELARVALAMLELERANLLVFDEPTNHLDVESIESLEDAISSFEGTVILVSHDRALLRALVTRVWILHDGRITDYPGTFAEWEQASAERAHAARVAASEETRVREVRERRKVRRQEDDRRDVQVARRAARRAVEAAEAAVAECEARVNRIQAELSDPDLYVAPGGIQRSVSLGAELEAARLALESAFEEWEGASRAAG
jgi:ATP-binding cassette subfamily F protein 3